MWYRIAQELVPICATRLLGNMRMRISNRRTTLRTDRERELSLVRAVGQHRALLGNVSWCSPPVGLHKPHHREREPV